ncbi:hypothetical protein JEQ12_006198 [Ovis aries]|uniref:Tripartite motif-containing protein 5-like n=1 Tax=Ovis aries TaxID=9940 RepID=A0A836CW36_SHEEP|nr:hypothetical protein JEQ12_006198 [Ovis aries]
MASGILMNIQEEVTCPICLELLTEPRSLDCGHTFCQACITANNEESIIGQEGKKSCPVCRVSFEPGNLRPNRHVANIVQRLREVKVSPEVEQERNLCAHHGEKLQLFCEQDGKVICWLCERSQEHRGHNTFLMEEIAPQYQKMLQSCLQRLNGKKQEAEELEIKVREEMSTWKTQIQTEIQSVQGEFTKLRQILDSEEEKELRKLKDELGVILKELAESENDLVQKKLLVSSHISDVECRLQGSTMELLQDVNVILKRSETVALKKPKSFPKEQRRVFRAPDLKEILRVFNGIVVSLQEEVTCPICLELLTEPLSLDCGHSFCQACITANNMVSMNDPDEDRRCPVCRISYEPGNLRPNRHVANIVQRLREVKLSPEVEQERNLCLRHGEKLMLFCEEDREVICWLCERSQEHHGHHTFLMEEVAPDYQKKLQEALEKLREKQLEAEELEVKVRADIAAWKDRIQHERQNVKVVFQKLRKNLKFEEVKEMQKLKCKEDVGLRNLADSEHVLIQQSQLVRNLISDVEHRLKGSTMEMLQELEREKLMTSLKKEETVLLTGLTDVQRYWELAESENDLDQENLLVNNLISDVERHLQGSTMELLQDVNDILKRSEIVALKEPKTFPKEQRRVFRAPDLREILRVFNELTDMQRYWVQVTLDFPKSANVVISPDQRQVRYASRYQRYKAYWKDEYEDFGVLGSPVITSGRHYWEVDVSKKRAWILGICGKKCKDIMKFLLDCENYGNRNCQKVYSRYQPENGFWVIGL